MYSALLEQREAWASNAAIRRAWFARTPEVALEPALEIVDPHHHLWDMRVLKGFNMRGILKQQYYLTDELIDDILGGGHKVTHTVFLECHSFHTATMEEGSGGGDPHMAPLGEVQFVQGTAAQFASGKYGPVRACAGIVGTADLAQFGAGVEPLLIACKAASPNFRGIRCVAAHDPKVPSGHFCPVPGLYRDETFRAGFALLHKHGLSFDAWLYSSQLPDLVDLAQHFPETTIILDHIGTPLAALGNLAGDGAPEYDGQQEAIIAQWKEHMTTLANECPNGVVKIGGLAMPQLGHGLEERDAPASSEELAKLFGPLYLWVIEQFGAERCMLESNFPVDQVSTSYTILWNMFKRVTGKLPEADRALLFSGTAKRVYRLGAAESIKSPYVVSKV
jgi:L-fuconolactonase